MQDPRELVALAHLVKLSAEIEVQLGSPEWEPIKAVLVRAQDEAASAIGKLIDTDPAKTDELRRLQNEVRRYESLVKWLREIVAEGKDASSKIDDARADELGGLIVDMDDETRAALGLREPGAGTE